MSPLSQATGRRRRVLESQGNVLMGHISADLKSTTSIISVEHEMKKSYMAYAMSVIVSRALPDVRDGLKPVHRRILYAMNEGGYDSGKPYKKSARAVGDVMGKYHPHGDASIYDAMVRMAQDFAMRHPLVDGQGNFGSIDGDPPAAMRYTEARMSKLADEGLTADIDKDTVDFEPTYDESGLEPTVLPARFPNVLVNGGTGIAVGMATNIPTHNLGEVIDATLAYIDNPAIDLDGLLALMPGPDFPTGGLILGRGAIREALRTGRGSITMSGVASIEAVAKNREGIVITELPYAVNKEKFVEAIGELVNDKTIEGVSDLRDESDREGIRVVVELKRDADPNLVLAKLKKHTKLVTTFGVNMTCLDSKGTPRVMSLLDVLAEFVAFRRAVIRRRTEHLLGKARAELNMQVGLFAARSQVDEVVAIVRRSKDREEARAALMALQFPTKGELGMLLGEADPDSPVPEVFALSEAQARKVLDLRLAALTGLELEGIAQATRGLLAQIRGFDAILKDQGTLDGVMRQELAEVKAKYAEPRRTRIESAGPADISEDDLVEQKPVVLTLTRLGYVKITALDSYREQARGGKGKSGMDTKDDDSVIRTIVCNTRTQLLIFTSRGIAHTLKAYKLPEAPANAKGRPIQNFIQLRQGEAIADVLPLPEDASALGGRYMMFVTSEGDVRRNDASDFANVNKTGKIAMKLEDDNGNPTARLINVLLCGEGDDLVMATRKGRANRFPITDVRVFTGRTSTGVKGITLAERGDEVIGASIIRHFEATAAEREAYLSGGTAKYKDEGGVEQVLTLTPERMGEMREAEQFLLTVTAQGYGKRFSSHDFRTTSRGSQGVWAGTFNGNTGDLLACFPVEEADGIVLVTTGGQTIRTRIKTVKENGAVEEIRVMLRNARGVRLFDLPDGQAIADVARVAGDDQG